MSSASSAAICCCLLTPPDFLGLQLSECLELFALPVFWVVGVVEVVEVGVVEVVVVGGVLPVVDEQFGVFFALRGVFVSEVVWGTS